MRFNAQIKKGAKNALRGNWGKLLVVLLVFLGFWLLLSTTESLIYVLFGFDPYMDPRFTPNQFLDDLPAHAIEQILISSGMTLVWLLVFSPLVGGGIRWLHAMTEGNSPEVKAFFSCFTSLRRYFRSVSAAVQIIVGSILWLAAFIAIPAGITLLFRMFPFPPTSPLALFAGYGVTAGWILMSIALFFCMICLQRYSLVYYYLAEDDTMSARNAVKKSVHAMDGHCGELFSLRISFFWWFLFSVLILPALYVLPYYGATVAIYARYRMEAQYRNDEVPTAPPAEWMKKPEEPAGELPSADEDKTQEYPVSEVRQQMEQEKSL